MSYRLSSSSTSSIPTMTRAARGRAGCPAAARQSARCLGTSAARGRAGCPAAPRQSARCLGRRLVTLSLLGAAAALLPGHSPYRQWYAYRAAHLVVVPDEMRPGALDLAGKVASAIATRWPETKAVPAAAQSPTEVVKLLLSGQLQVGLVPSAVAVEALEGRGKFAESGKVPLRAVAVVGGDLLVVLESCARERAQAIAQALVEFRNGELLPKKPSLRGPAPIPFHPGALEYYERVTGS